MIKATRKYKTNGEGCMFISTKHLINKNTLINVTMFLMDGNRDEKVSKSAVEKRLRSELMMSGMDFDSYVNERIGIDEDEFDELKEKATEKAEELFPDFF